METLPLFPMDYKRLVAKEPRIHVINRYAERNPSLNEEPVSMISRPGMKKLAQIGSGPIRKTFSQPGTFNGALFVVSNTSLYRYSTAGVSTYIGELSTDPFGDVSMAATAPIGDTVPAYLFLADGSVLWCYTENGSAQGQLQVTGAIANGDQVRIGTVYYQFTTGAVTTGNGTSGSPWLVKIGITDAVSLQNLYNAINAAGEPGVDYSTNLLDAHPEVVASRLSTADLYVLARVAGTLGNAIVTTETGANMAWGSGTLINGGTNQLRQVYLPDDLGAVSVAVINSYVIVIPFQDVNNKGQFYWLEPGEQTVDPLNYATAERNPDGLHQVIVFGDMFWLLGENTTEPWVTTGDQLNPMQRMRGILFDRGSWEGTAVQVKDSLIVVDEDGGVFQISGGQKRISRPDIEERIRRAKQIEKFFS